MIRWMAEARGARGQGPPGVRASVRVCRKKIPWDILLARLVICIPLVEYEPE